MSEKFYNEITPTLVETDFRPQNSSQPVDQRRLDAVRATFRLSPDEVLENLRVERGRMSNDEKNNHPSVQIKDAHKFAEKIIDEANEDNVNFDRTKEKEVYKKAAISELKTYGFDDGIDDLSTDELHSLINEFSDACALTLDKQREHATELEIAAANATKEAAAQKAFVERLEITQDIWASQIAKAKDLGMKAGMVF